MTTGEIWETDLVEQQDLPGSHEPGHNLDTAPFAVRDHVHAPIQVNTVVKQLSESLQK